MFAPSFEYYRAGSVADVQKLWKQHPDAKVLAGGHSLIPLLKLRLAAPPALIDIGRIKALRGIKVSGKKIQIGALTTHADLATSAALRSSCPMLADAAAHIGDPQVRNCGTIGGNVAHADPASDLPTVLLALDAIFTVVGPKKTRRIQAAEFFQGMMATALKDREIVTAIEVPAAPAGTGMSYAKFSHPASRYAVLGAAAVVATKNGKCTTVHVAIGGLLPAPVRAEAVEAALEGAKPTDEAIAKASALVAKSLGRDVLEDVYASASYRQAMGPVYVRRALTAALARAK